MFCLGVVSVSFRNLTVDEVIEYTDKAGLSLIEWGSDVHAPSTDRKKLEYIARRQKEFGVRTSSYGTYFRLGRDDTEQLYEYAQAARILGTSVLRIWCGDKNYEDTTKEERIAIIAEARKAAKIAEELGITLCLECHNLTFTNSLSGAVDIMKSVDSPAFRMYWQPSVRASAEENLRYAEGIAPYVVNLHVCHYENGKKKPLSDGAPVWERYLSCFAKDKALLLEFMPNDDPDELTREAKTLKSLATGRN